MRSEQQSLPQKDLPPCGLRLFWAVASWILGKFSATNGQLFARSLVLSLLVAASPASALVFTNMYEFSPGSFNDGSPDVQTNGDGLNPAGFVLAAGVLYGTTSGGGTYGGGTIFRVNTDGSDFTNIFNFNNGSYDPATGTYPDSTGINPQAGLLLISNTLYGTTFAGGLHGAGAPPILTGRSPSTSQA